MSSADRGLDIPGWVVVAFVLSFSGLIFSGFAGIAVAGDLLSVDAQRDLTDAAAPTLFGLAVAPVLGSLGGGIALATRLRRQRLGRSLAWAAVVLGLMSLFNLIAYAAALSDLEDESDATEIGRSEPASDALPDGSEPSPPVSGGGDLPDVVANNPEPGRYVTADALTCPYDFLAQDGTIVESGEGDFTDVPAGVAQFRSNGCEWVLVSG